MYSMNYEDLTILGIALGLGMLVGLQREHSQQRIAGVRTFTLIAILGTVAGFLTRDMGNQFILPALGLSLAVLIYAGGKSGKSEADPGKTTEVAILLMFAIGAYLVLGDRVIGVVAGGLLTMLLYAKARLHSFIDKLKDSDISAIMTLAGISLIILPILPDQTYGPYDVLNPHNIWLMVVFIVGLSVVGYFIYKFVGKDSGVISNGILGGLISSTATTVSFARKQKQAPNIAKVAVFVITTASAIALARVLIEIFVVAPGEFAALAMPIAFNFVIMGIICAWLFYTIKSDDESEELPEPENPAQLKAALIFGFLYGLILLLVAFTKEQFGSGGLYIVAIISGLTDVDAITLSLAQMIKGDELETNLGWKLILLASLSNLLFKGVMAAIIGTGKIVKWLAIAFGLSIAVGLLTIFLWPQAWHF
ncbi:MgtC/SapB family protein [Autumnicola psychrophila]|uniref:MgtC/SapB family protein n=1 Tax=Autumnicola psychrophila TaxID=3075592 RepID=A0ABU3DN09_9FLAO|nr:MgtC/SapB family protein [Zunongwangia sp. F225]MDT0685104.1 MgtC/SapB family protein [Zunongwangia sp. F225]